MNKGTGTGRETQYFRWPHMNVRSGTQMVVSQIEVEGMSIYKNIYDSLRIYIWKHTNDLHMKICRLDLLHFEST